jgi:hypothetical protein
MLALTHTGASRLLRTCTTFAIAALTVACSHEIIVKKAAPAATPADDTTTSTDDTDSTPLDAGDGTAHDAGTKDSAPPPGPDPTTIFPAPHGTLPQVPYWGGGFLESMQIVTVTFTGDALRNVAEAFDDGITSTAWWDAVNAGNCDKSGHCIGHGGGAGHVHLAPTNLPQTLDEQPMIASGTVWGFINTLIQSGKLPPPSATQVYAFYIPSSTTVTSPSGTPCQDIGGYHATMAATAPGSTTAVTFPYIIMGRCPNDDQDALTSLASHELVETATDPYVSSGAIGFSSGGDAWDMNGGGEVGDRCELYWEDQDQQQQMYVRESGYMVQRIWNNAAAVASHDPCVPAPAPTDAPYFNVVSDSGDDQRIAVGAQKTVTMTAFSEVPFTQPFDIEVQELTGKMGGTDVLDLFLDRTSVSNGEKVNVSVTLKSAPSAKESTYGPGSLAIFQVVSTYGAAKQYSLVEVGVP